MRTLLVYIAVLMAMAGCKKSACWKAHGDVASEIRQLDAFSIIEVFDQVDVELVQDSVNFVEISGGANMLDHVTTEVVGKSLFIHNNNSCSFLRDYDRIVSMRIHASNLGEIHHWGVGDITAAQPIVADTFGIEVLGATGDITLELQVNQGFSKIHTGPGDIYLTGKANDWATYMRGNGFIYGLDFETKAYFGDFGGTGDAEIWVTERFGIKTSEFTNVTLKGDPEFYLQELEGSGRLIRY